MYPQYNLNDILYLVRGATVAKCRIEEIIEHRTQTKIIVKYIAHVYGIPEYITVETEDLYLDLQTAIDVVTNNIDTICNNYKSNLKNATDEIFEQKENELLAKQKGEI